MLFSTAISASFRPGMQAFDAIHDDFQIGVEKLLAKLRQLLGQVRAAETIENHHQSVGFAQDGEPARVVLAFGKTQAGRIEKGDLGVLCLLRLELGRHFGQPFIRDVPHAGLALLDLRRVRLDARQPLEKRALSRPGISDQSDFHDLSVVHCPLTIVRLNADHSLFVVVRRSFLQSYNES